MDTTSPDEASGKEAEETSMPSPISDRLRQILNDAADDTAVAEAMVSSGLFAEIAGLATMNATEVSSELGIQQDSVRKLSRKSKTFPSPIIADRRYSTAQIIEYGKGRQRRS